MNNIFKIAESQVGLYVRRGVRIALPLKLTFFKTKAIQTESGIVLVPQYNGLSLEEILDIYGGKIIDIEIQNNDFLKTPYYTDNNFSKVKNKKALNKAYLRLK